MAVSAIVENELALRDSLWPDAEKRTWKRKEHGGFMTVPKTLPFVARAMDEMTKNHPVSSTYQALLAFTWDNSFVRMKNLEDIAFAAGFTGQRGVRTLQDRLKRLEALGFVELKASGATRLAFAYLPNPHSVLFRLHDASISETASQAEKDVVAGLQDATWTAFLARAQEIGCKDVRAMLDRRSGKTKAATGAAAPRRPKFSKVRRTGRTPKSAEG